MSLTVYQFAHSPYCLPITRALEALHVGFAKRNISNADRREIILLTNGVYYQVPVLEHSERVIYESSDTSLDVAHYVDLHFGGGRLFPVEHEGLQRLVIDHLENTVEGVTFRLVDPLYLQSIDDPVERMMIVRHKERKFGRGCVADWAARRESLTQETRNLLEPYNLTLRHSPFLFGPAPVYADFALYGILANLTYSGYNTLPEGLEALAAWYSSIKTFRW